MEGKFVEYLHSCLVIAQHGSVHSITFECDKLTNDSFQVYLGEVVSTALLPLISVCSCAVRTLCYLLA